MALSLRDVRCDPIANRALNELMHHYTVAQEKSRLVLTKKTGDMKLFLNDLDDLHQWDFIRNSAVQSIPPHLQDHERARRKLALLIIRHMESGEPDANLGTVALLNFLRATQ
jgi:hypothetical protein